MTNLPKIAISVGDLNGIGIEIALKCTMKKFLKSVNQFIVSTIKC